MGEWYMKNKEIISEWLKRAKSNLEIAGAGKSSKEILYEDLCIYEPVSEDY